MKRAVLIAAIALGLSGCGTTWSRRAEIAFQVLNAIDTAQTVTALNGTKCHEASPLLGNNPSPGGAAIAGVGVGVLHGFATHWLEDHDASKTQMIIYHSLSIAAKTFAVVSNANQGC